MTKIYVSIKRIAVASVFALATVLTQFAVVLPASAASLTWTGAAGDNKFSTVSNWNTGQAPVNGDILNFSVATLTETETLDNDIANLSVAGINFAGSVAAYRSYTITGNALTLTGNVANTSLSTQGGSYPIVHSINTNLLIGGAATFTNVSLGGTTLNTQTNALTFTGTAGCGVAVSNNISGSGSITSSATRTQLSGTNTGYTGPIAITAGNFYAKSTGLGSAAAGTTVSGSGTLLLIADTNQSIAEPLTLGGSGELRTVLSESHGCSGGGAQPAASIVTLTGDITLQSNFIYNGENNTVITGDYTSNGHVFSVKSGSPGSLTTPEGEVVVPEETITFSGDQPSKFETVGNKQTGVLEGTRSGVGVSNGGLLKGTGTARSLTVSQGGVVAPGNSPGKLTVLQDYRQYGEYRAEIQNATSYDQLAIGANYTDSSNAVTLEAGATLNVSLFEGWSVKQGDAFRIIDNLSTTAVSGTFAGLAEGTQFTVNGIVFSITYVGGDGNDVVITALNAGNDPAAPNTGALRQALANPIVVLALGLVTATVLAGIALRRRAQR